MNGESTDRLLSRWAETLSGGYGLATHETRWLLWLARRMFDHLIEIEHRSEGLAQSKRLMDGEINEALDGHNCVPEDFAAPKRSAADRWSDEGIREMVAKEDREWMKKAEEPQLAAGFVQAEPEGGVPLSPPQRKEQDNDASEKQRPGWTPVPVK